MARVLEKISTDRPSLGDAALDKYKESADWPSPTGVEAANDPGAGSSFWGAVGGWARRGAPSETLSVTVETEDGSTCVSSSDRDEVSVATANRNPTSFSRVKIAVVRPSADSDEGARVCAIKVCHKARILEADEVVSILREKDALTVVKHPFVMELFGTHQDADRCYFVCEYIPGGELFTYIHNVCSGSMADVDAQFYAGQQKSAKFPTFYAACVADAFEHAHGLGVINRDAKPENIVIDAYGYPKLCDWGFAKTDVKRGDACLTICGTLEYLSREVLLNLGYAFDVDLWTLGVLIFEMIAGRTPFYDPLMADNLQQQSIYDNILHGDVVLPNWDVPDVVLKLLDSETDITHFQDQGVDLDEDDADADLLFHGDDASPTSRRAASRAPSRGGRSAPARGPSGSARADA
ncbi:cAMP-dependent protein kinase [Aureococcus anophagefferens]|nr:cAMP-dependent protein kinase [Aureococcus anophagefferens]